MASSCITVELQPAASALIAAFAALLSGGDRAFGRQRQPGLHRRADEDHPFAGGRELVLHGIGRAADPVLGESTGDLKLVHSGADRRASRPANLAVNGRGTQRTGCVRPQDAGAQRVGEEKQRGAATANGVRLSWGRKQVHTLLASTCFPRQPCRG
jgi:hypothetical protein